MITFYIFASVIGICMFYPYIQSDHNMDNISLRSNGLENIIYICLGLIINTFLQLIVHDLLFSKFNRKIYIAADFTMAILQILINTVILLTSSINGDSSLFFTLISLEFLVFITIVIALLAETCEDKSLWSYAKCRIILLTTGLGFILRLLDTSMLSFASYFGIFSFLLLCILLSIVLHNNYEYYCFLVNNKKSSFDNNSLLCLIYSFSLLFLYIFQIFICFIGYNGDQLRRVSEASQQDHIPQRALGISFLEWY